MWPADDPPVLANRAPRDSPSPRTPAPSEVISPERLAVAAAIQSRQLRESSFQSFQGVVLREHDPAFLPRQLSLLPLLGHRLRQPIPIVRI